MLGLVILYILIYMLNFECYILSTSTEAADIYSSITVLTVFTWLNAAATITLVSKIGAATIRN